MLRPNVLRERGVAMVEFHVALLFALLPLCLGTLQIALLLVANHHLDHAAFQATRHAATEQGSELALRSAFTKAMIPLFMHGGDGGGFSAQVIQAHLRATGDLSRYLQLRVLAPDQNARQDFALPRNGGQVIPNDALMYRSATPGRSSRISLQQANILQVEFTYCQDLVVPFAAQLLVAVMQPLVREPWQRFCLLAGRLPIRALGIAPMQSDFRVSG
jgi:hypothetical protein